MKKWEYYRKITEKEAEIMQFIQKSTLFEKNNCKNKEKNFCDTEIVHQDLYYNMHIGELFRTENMLESTGHFKAYLIELQTVLSSLKKIESAALAQSHWKYNLYPEWYLKKKLSETEPDFSEVFEDLLLQQNEIFMEYLKWHQRYNYKLKAKNRVATS